MAEEQGGWERKEQLVVVLEAKGSARESLEMCMDVHDWQVCCVCSLRRGITYFNTWSIIEANMELAANQKASLNGRKLSTLFGSEFNGMDE